MSPYLLLFLGSMLVASAASIMISAIYNYSLSRLLERLRDRDEEVKERYRHWADSEDLSYLTALLLRGMAVVVAVFAFYQGYPELHGADASWLRQFFLVTFCFFVVIFAGCVVPELWAAYFAETIVQRGMPLMRVLEVLIRPLSWLAEFFDLIGMRLLGAREIPEEDQVTDDILDGLNSGERARFVNPEQTEMIKSIFELDETDVRDIMTPRTDVVMIQVDTPLMEAVQEAIECGHSRIPVFGQNRDEIVGILCVKDLLKTWVAGGAEKRDLRGHLRRPFFVPETRQIRDLLAEMRGGRFHVAVILDEYGGCAGIVTIEDIVEEIVGEIQDEHDTDEDLENLVKTDDGAVECDGQTHIEEIEDLLGVKLEGIAGDLDTVGGYVFARLGKIPAINSQHIFSNIRFSVLDSDDRRINRLRVEVLAGNGNP